MQPKRPNGRPRHPLVCDQYPGRTFTVHEAAELAGVGDTAIPCAVRRGRPTGPHKLMFRKFLPRPAAPDPDEQWFDNMEYAFERHGDTVKELVKSTDGRVEVMGLVMTPDSHFEDIDADIHCIVALMLDRNSLRDELFAACRTVLPMIERTNHV